MFELSVCFYFLWTFACSCLILRNNGKEREWSVFDGSQCHFFAVLAEHWWFERAQESFPIDDSRDYLVGMIGQLDDSCAMFFAGDDSQYSYE